MKGSIGRFVLAHTLSIAAVADPVSATVPSVSRTWRDTNGNYVSDCDLYNVDAGFNARLPRSALLGGGISIGAELNDIAVNERASAVPAGAKIIMSQATATGIVMIRRIVS